MAEARRHRHFRMTAPIGFQVGAVAERRADSHDDAAGLRRRERLLAHLDPSRRDERCYTHAMSAERIGSGNGWLFFVRASIAATKSFIAAPAAPVRSLKNTVFQ